MVADTDDYTFLTGGTVLGFDFCLTFVREHTPDQIIARLGGHQPVTLAGAHTLRGAAETVSAWPDVHGDTHRSDLLFAAAVRCADWTMLLGPEGPSWSGEAVSFRPRDGGFRWVRDDETLAACALGDRGARALTERLTGVRVTPEFLAAARFRCAGVPDPDRPAPADRVLREAREELVDYAEHGDDERDPWLERGVVEKCVCDTGDYGVIIHDEDEELARIIAYAPADLLDRILAWARDRAFRRVGVHGAPWFAPIRDRLDRGVPVPADELRRADRRLAGRAASAPGVVRAMLRPPSSDTPAGVVCEAICDAAEAEDGDYRTVVADLRDDLAAGLAIELPPRPHRRETATALRRRLAAADAGWYAGL
ncbi:DUF6461 domain-containing protein [Actinoplanes rectilineatus]|uniref:DUF6461 domain-containing protein n=1 Tax=Actinoplanes rectilineatus TaxID=113571 RepID=UPI0005F29F9B|nr:DUF6461 domain-containing protein [Actinoplanes rectilineatus]